MGVTITVAFAFWLASSYIEYRIIVALPWTKPIFDHPLGGIMLSILIGLFVGAVMGPVAGVGAALGQLVGLATNKMTFEMYSKGHDFSQGCRQKYEQFTAFTERNKSHIVRVRRTVTYAGQVAGVIFVTFAFIFGLPARGVDFYHRIRYGTYRVS